MVRMRNLPTKIVLRNLPPKLTEDLFKEMCSPIPPYDYFRFCQPDPSLGGKGFSRAYINFCDPQSVFAFRERFLDYVFVDSEGNEATAIVEYAAFQGTPNSPPVSKVDRRQGTIEQDATYQKFLSGLNDLRSETSEDNASNKTVAKTPWEATLEALEKRDAAASQQVETALTRFLNLRLEKGKRSLGEDFKGMSKRAMRASRNLRKARQRQAALAAAPIGSDAATQSAEVSQKSGENNRGGVEKPPPTSRGPKTSRSNKLPTDSSFSSFNRSDDSQQSTSAASLNSLPVSGGRGGRRGCRRSGNAGSARSHRMDAPPSYSSRHAAAVSETSTPDSGGCGVGSGSGPKHRGGGHRGGGGQRGGPSRPSSYFSRGRSSANGAAHFKQ